MQIIKAAKKLLNKLSKIFIVVVVFFVVINLFFAFTAKDKIKIDPEETTKNQRAEIYKILNDPQYQKTPQGKTSLALYRGMLCAFIGEACTDNPADDDKNYNKSIMGFMGNLIALPYANPPASGVYYAYDTLQNAGFIPKAYAAEGIGFASLKPLLNIWKAFRNVAYLILVIVLIAIGFMIMFRMKLNPQTVVSMENTLPKIIVSMILITFSFAIAGFLIDLMYFGIALIVSLLSTVDIKGLSINNLPDTRNKYVGAPFQNILPLITNKDWLSSLFVPYHIGQALMHVLPSWLHYSIGGASTVLSAFLTQFIAPKLATSSKIANFIADRVSIDWAKPVTGGLALVLFIASLGFSFFAPGLLMGILFGFTLLFLLFRVFFLLLKTYVFSLILIVFAPIFLLFNSIPGKNVFSFWLKSLIGELLTFPLVVFLILLGYLLANLPGVQGDLFTPPFLTGIGDKQAFGAILGMAIILLIPQLVKTSKELIGIKGMPDFKPGFMAGGATLIGGGLGLISQFGSLSLAMPWLRKGVGGIPFLGSLFRTDEMQKEWKEAQRIKQLEKMAGTPENEH